MPVFSIIIPIYNVAQYLPECLRSIFSQKFKSWEAILIDDGSTDGSSAVCDYYANIDSRFKVIHQSNHGVSFARNKGIENAIGEWVWFVDGDDYIQEDALFDLYHVIQNHSFDTLFFANYNRILEINHIDINIVNSYSKNDFLKIVNCYFNQKMLFNRMIIKHNNILFPLNLKMAEDLEFQYKYLYCASKPFLYCKELYIYRNRDGSATQNTASVVNNMICSLEVSKNLLKFLKYRKITKNEWLTKRINRLLKGALQSWYFVPLETRINIKSEIKEIISGYNEIGVPQIYDFPLKLASVNLHLYFFILKLYHMLK